jgi:acyl dehydratase
MSTPRRLDRTAVSEGMVLGEAVFGPLTAADIERYARASGDLNPLHRDERYARSTGAPTVFAMGLLPAGQLTHAVSDWVGGPDRLRRLWVRFVTRVWPGDELVCSGRVESIDGALATLALQASRRGAGPAGLDLPAEEVALTGLAVVELP